MKVFWVRFSMFFLLWILIVLRDNIEQVPVSIITLAVALGIYFLLSLQKVPLLLYGLLSVLIFIHNYYYIHDSLISIILIFYMTMDSAFRLKEKVFNIYIVVNLLLTLLMVVMNRNQWMEMTILSSFCYFLLFSINVMTNERREQRNLYEELLSEYRKLVRMNLNAESDARMKERTKIARDIHDSVGHRLTALIMKLEMLTIFRKRIIATMN